MGYLLGIDTGGTYTDAALLDEDATRVVAAAKALTTRPDLATGIGAAIDAALDHAGVAPTEVALVSLSTTLATNALVEGQGGQVALVFIGFSEAELSRAGLSDALRGDPVIRIAGGHSHDGAEAAALDLAALERGLAGLPSGVTAFAVAAAFATRNPAHERMARDLLRARTGLPVTCSHELSAGLNGPKRALTAVLNARLVGMIARLIDACEGHLARLGIAAPLMVVRGDGALVSAALARERPIETILSGPAASIEGARWLTGETDALVADIGGTTTDVALLRGGHPEIDPAGARVGGFRTMVEAVAMRTTGLGGDSEVRMGQGLGAGLILGPRRLVPVSLLAAEWPDMVHAALDRALQAEAVGEHDGRFAMPLWQGAPPAPANPREEGLLTRLAAGPLRLGDALRNRMDEAVLDRLVTRGQAMVAGLTPSDAAHALGLLWAWDGAAAEKALTLFARRRDASGSRLAPDAKAMARLVIERVTRQTVTCLLEGAFAEDDRDWGAPPEALAAHALTLGGLYRHRGVVEVDVRLGVPVIGLGASAASYYGAVGEILGTRMLLPEHAGVANAIGAVVGRVAMRAEGTVTAPAQGRFVAHLPDGPESFADSAAAMAALAAGLAAQAVARARAAGVAEAEVSITQDVEEAEIEGQTVFVSGRVRAVASGRPRTAQMA